MVKQLEIQIKDLQKELTEIKKQLADLRLQPCLRDSEIRAKDEKLEELDGRAAVLTETLRDLTRKRQLLLSESAPRTVHNSPGLKKVHSVIRAFLKEILLFPYLFQSQKRSSIWK